MSENAQAKKNTQENQVKGKRRGRVEAPKVHQRTFDTATELQTRLAGPNHEEEMSHFLTPAASDLATGASGSLAQRQSSARVSASSHPAAPSFTGWNFSHIPAQAGTRTRIQPKLMVGSVNDPHEQEADRMAKRVVSTPTPTQTNDGSSQGIMQRQEENDLAQMKPQLVQRNSAAGFATDDTFAANLDRQRGRGVPLPVALRADFEPQFGADFSGVRVHTNTQSHQLNQSIQAKAFTTGQDIFFRQGAYEPGGREGQELIAHELTHVVQQNGGAMQRQGGLTESVNLVSPSTRGAVVQRTETALADKKLKNVLKPLGYKGADPKINSLVGSVSIGGHKLARVHATQYLANTSQKSIKKDTPITEVMNDVFGGAYPKAHHVTAEVFGEKAPAKNPHFFYDGTYVENNAPDVKEADMEKLLTDERNRIEKILKRDSFWS
jgi:hypothetical protein